MTAVIPPKDRLLTAEGDRVRALEELGVLGTAPEERFDRITRMAQKLFGVDAALITLIGHNRQWIKSSEGQVPTAAFRDDTFCAHTIRQPDTLVVRDATTDARFAGNPAVTDAPHLRFYAGHPIEAPGGHRVGTLCLLDARVRELSDRERAQLRELALLAQAELRSTVELDRAAQVQRGLQPHASTMVVPGYDLAGVCLASRVVGGDLLDWYYTAHGDLAITLGDVMGKGMGAAIIMATVRGAMRAAGRLHPPAETLRRAAAAVEEDLQKTSTMVTMCHAVVTPATGRVVYSDAGHGLCMVVQADGHVLRGPEGGLPLGIVPDDRWAEHHGVIRPGDTMVTFSDGLLDLYDDTVDTTIAEVARVAHASPDARSVVDHFAALARRSNLPDDVTVLALRRSAVLGRSDG